MTTKQTPAEKLYIGVDVGGTKIQVSLITASGAVLADNRRTTPRNGSAESTLDAVEDAIRELLHTQNRTVAGIQAVGIAVPGVVQQESGYVVVTPNMNLSGVELGQRMRERLNVPIAVGNDCNLGTLGECWLGSGRNAASCVGIFVGTGIGAGIVYDQRIWAGAGQAAGEIGHIVSQAPCESWRSVLGLKKKDRMAKIDGGPTLPRCGCGNHGCFETFASRTAVERFIREAIDAGAKSIIAELNGGNLDVIKSGALAKAIKADDSVVTAIVRYAAQMIGYACLTVRHLFDPEVIVLGGGVIEACHKFMIPVIDAVVSNDQLPSAPGNRRILVSSLGDDAVVLGAVALARSLNGTDPLKRVRTTIPKYPVLRMMAESIVPVAEIPCSTDFISTSDATVQPRPKRPKKNPHGFRLKDLQISAKGGSDLIILATPHAGEVALSGKCHDFLFRRGIDYRILPLNEAVQLYNSVPTRRSAVFHFEPSSDHEP